VLFRSLLQNLNQEPVPTETKLVTSYINTDSTIFSSLCNAFSLLQHDEIAEQIKSIDKSSYVLVYIACLLQGLLDARHSLVFFGSNDWSLKNVAFLAQLILFIKSFDMENLKEFPSLLMNEVIINYIDNLYEKDYVFAVLVALTNSFKTQTIQINDTSIPFPPKELGPSDFKSWFQKTIVNWEIDSNVLQLHDKLINQFSKLKAEEFIENLQQLWDINSSGSNSNLASEIKPDVLNFAIRKCRENLPPYLKLNILQKSSINALISTLNEEFIEFNQKLRIINNHLSDLEKYLLTNTQLFPIEWKNIALSLQLQRVPQEWGSTLSRTSIHSLMSWISYQKVRYEKLSLLKKDSGNLGPIDVSILHNPSRLFNSLVIQSCFENKLNIDEVELKFEIKMDKASVPDKDAILLTGFQIVGGVYDPESGDIKFSDELYNKLPPLVVYVAKKAPKEDSSEPEPKLRVYMNRLQLEYIMSLPLKIADSKRFNPFTVLDIGQPENESKRRTKSLATNLLSIIESSKKLLEEPSQRSKVESSNLNLVFSSSSNQEEFDKKNLVKSGPASALSKIHEKSDERLSSPESQLSYQALTPNAPQLPSDLNTLQRDAKQLF